MWIVFWFVFWERSLCISSRVSICPCLDFFSMRLATGAHIVQDVCNGHVTPGLAGATYHYHRAPVCANAGNTNAEPTPYTDLPGTHSPQLAWANDGFAIYGNPSLDMVIFHVSILASLACHVTHCVYFYANDLRFSRPRWFGFELHHHVQW
jgi:hypothetical protein